MLMVRVERRPEGSGCSVRRWWCGVPLGEGERVGRGEVDVNSGKRGCVPGKRKCC